jgi:hypothetical protein
MNAFALRDALRLQPFKPFTMTLVDGRSYEIRHPELVIVSPKGRQAIIVNEDESWSVLEPLLILSLDYSAPKSSNGPAPPPP